MKFLFVMRHPAAVRSLTSVLRLLDGRGHRVHLAFGGVKPEAHKVLQRLADELQHLTFGSLPARGAPGWTKDSVGWTALVRRLRVDSDYLRYLEPSYEEAPALRARAEANAHPTVRRVGRAAHRVGPWAVHGVKRALELAERSVEPPPHVVQFLQDFDPDVVVVTHLARDSVQADYVRAANRLGLHSAYPVFSWDNLTNKGLVHELPEVVLVWNESQAKEAVELQDIPRGRVRVLGAWSYDHWFDWQPSTSREEFCARVGLRADRPIALYVCSSGFVARDEVAFVRRWLAGLRARGNEAGVIVRPHPRNAAQWAGVELDDPQAVVWPKLGEEPLESESRKNYFDSIYHSAAVVGINTSAQIESAVVGRPVHTVLADEFKETQQGTLHFQYLKDGHLWVGQTLDEHLDQLEESLRGREDDGRNERFLLAFVRPRGLEVAATPLYVETLEELGSEPRPEPERGPAPLLRRALSPVAAAAGKRAAARKNSERDAFDELRSVLRKVKRGEGEVVAGPWLGSEVEELLYWIPFLRWAQTATFGLRDRLAVVARASSAAWYEGIGSTHADAADFEGEPTIPPKLIEELRDELAAGDPKAPFSRRRLEFPAAPPGGADYAGPWGGRGGARSPGGPAGDRRLPAARARAHARRVVPAGPPPDPRARAGLMEVETPPWERLDEREEYAALVRQRLEHLVPVTDPLVLCSQIQRSGGTLLSQLFDGHPECHAHPHEIKIGWPREANWPPLDLDRPGEWFERLFEKKALTHFVEGYQKRGAKLEAKSYPSYDVFPFLFLPRLQKAIFDARAAGATSERDVLDAYFTSYFNAWLDNQSLYTGPKKVVTGFTPRLAMDAENRDKFFAAYPDGTLVAIVREPQSWYRSAVKYSERRFPDAETAIGLWRESAEAALDERVVLVTYERLVSSTEDVMTRLAERIGIAMSPVLLEPTFNGRPIRANSADEVAQYGILATREQPDPDPEIAELAGDLYGRAVTVSV